MLLSITCRCLEGLDSTASSALCLLAVFSRAPVAGVSSLPQSSS